MVPIAVAVEEIDVDSNVWLATTAAAVAATVVLGVVLGVVLTHLAWQPRPGHASALCTKSSETHKI